jgi:monoamine oxidase
MIDVAVIGAGSAGIAATRLLRKAGLSVQLLEARSRVGGRAFTDHRSLGRPADLGAAWLHFADANPWTALAREQGRRVIERDPGWGTRGLVAGLQPTPEESASTEAGFEACWSAVESAAESGLDVPVSTLLDNDPFRPRFDALMTWIMGVESHAVSSLDLARYADSKADWAVAEGLGSVVAESARGLPVSLDTSVTALDWSDDGVRITSTRGVFDARAAIITVPTAVLSRGTIRFTPALPDTHANAIECLPLGSNNKVFFRFDEADLPWPEPTHCLVHADRSRTVHVGIRAAGQPLVMTYFGGELSRDLERRGELVAYARDALAQCFGPALVSRVRATLATGWDADPFAGGSYSAALPGSATQREVLATAVSPRLYFAGEACDVHHYGTLYGAWRSGVRAAGRLIETLGSSP